MTAPPGLARTAPTAQTRTPRPGERSAWADREVLLQCRGCGTKVTGHVIRGELTFHAMTEVDATVTIAQDRWMDAENQGHRRVADKLLLELRQVRDEPVRWIHRTCGGVLRAFDFPHGTRGNS